MKYTLGEVATITNAEYDGRNAQCIIRKVIYDSRLSTGSGGELFIALPGSRFDGHDFIPQMVAAGVSHFMVSKSTGTEGIDFLKVADTLEALQQLASAHRLRYQIPVVGITGSNAKTIVKEWLGSILSQGWSTVKSPKSYNSQLGASLSVLEMDHSHEVGVFEAGISQPSEMSRLQKVIRPSVGIFTNIGSAHAEGFSSLDQKLSEKSELFTESETIVCCKAHTQVYAFLQEKFPSAVCAWGIDDAKAQINFQTLPDGYRVCYHQYDFTFQLALHQPQGIENALHAVSAALILGVEAGHIVSGVSHFRPLPMRLQSKRGRNGTYILDDTYNNDLQGLEVGLQYLQRLPGNKNTVILSDVLQSGMAPEVLYPEVCKLLDKYAIYRMVGIGEDIAKCMPERASFEAGFYPDTASFLHDPPAFVEENILVKGARGFGLERIVAFLEEKNHGTVLEIDMEALIHNLVKYQSKLKPATKTMVMVKALAYGAGVEEVAHLLQFQGVDYLGVAYVDEAVALRRKGIRTPIMVMNTDAEGLALLADFDLEPEVYSLDFLRSMLATRSSNIKVHLKVDTGMNRLGFSEEDLEAALALIKQNRGLRVVGIMSHLASAEDTTDDSFSRQQFERFERMCQAIAGSLGYMPIRHMLNSAGIARWTGYQYDMVRLGIGLYGYDSTHSITGLRNISTLKARVSQIRDVGVGETIGYSRKGRLNDRGRVAVLALGYADGYRRAYGNGAAYVMLNGKKAYTVGNICMDMTMVDVTGLDVKIGDLAVVFGESPTVQELAEWAGTIPYEVLTDISSRVKRVFSNG